MHAARSVALALAVEIAGTASACGTPPASSTTHVWMAPVSPTTPARAPLRSVAVLAPQADGSARRTLEDALVEELARHGVAAVASYTLFPDGVPSRDEVIDRANADGILVAQWNEPRVETRHEPASYQPDFWRVYGPATTPPSSSVELREVKTEPIAKVEAALWDTRMTDEIVWSARSKVTKSSSSGGTMQGVSKEIASSLANAGLIPP